MERTMEEEEESSNGTANILGLSKELLKQVIIRTSPRDACRFSLAGLFVFHVAESDAVWEHFLPSDLSYILDHPLEHHASKKDLYLRLSDSNKPILLDIGRTLFRLERSTGTKCYILSSRMMEFEHGNNPDHWNWIHHPSSRFSQVAELLVVYWFDIRCSIESTKLSPNMNYAAYLLFKLETNSKGLVSTNMVASIMIGQGDSRTETESIVRLTGNNNALDEGILHRRETESIVRQTWLRYGSIRKDGWLEIEIAEFYIEENMNTCLKFRLRELNTENKKTGLIVEGMEIRPKNLAQL